VAGHRLNDAFVRALRRDRLALEIEQIADLNRDGLHRADYGGS